MASHLFPKIHIKIIWCVCVYIYIYIISSVLGNIRGINQAIANNIISWNGVISLAIILPSIQSHICMHVQEKSIRAYTPNGHQILCSKYHIYMHENATPWFFPLLFPLSMHTPISLAIIINSILDSIVYMQACVKKIHTFHIFQKFIRNL